MIWTKIQMDPNMHFHLIKLVL